MSADDFTIQLPSWPMQHLLKEACGYWNIRHPEAKAFSDRSEWPLLYNVVLSYLRHSHSCYDQALAQGANREGLRERISRAARIAYPWLRIERDPRKTEPATGEPSKHERPFNRFSRQLATLVGQRARLTEALAYERRHQAEGWRIRLAQTQKQLAKVNTQIERLSDLFEPSVKPDQDGKGTRVHPLYCRHSVPGYDFAGRALTPNYTERAGFTCPKCSAQVLRTKCALPVGAGKKELVLSCHCSSVIIPPKYGRGLDPERWLAITGSNKPVILLDSDGVLYGHELAKDVAEGRKSQQDVKVFRDIKPEAFFAFLDVRFGQEPCVAALRDKDSVSNQDLERISREIVLCVADAETILESQESIEALSEEEENL